MKLKHLVKEYDSNKIKFSQRLLVFRQNLKVKISLNNNDLLFKYITVNSRTIEHEIIERIVPFSITLVDSNRNRLKKSNYHRWEAKL